MASGMVALEYENWGRTATEAGEGGCAGGVLESESTT